MERDRAIICNIISTMLDNPNEFKCKSYKNNRAFLQVGEKGYFDDTTEAASAIFDMHEQIKNLEAQLAQCQQVVKDFPQYRGSLLEKDELCQQIEDAEKRLLEREALLALKDKRVEVLEAENERLQNSYPAANAREQRALGRCEGMERAAEIAQYENFCGSCSRECRDYIAQIIRAAVEVNDG